MTYRAADILGHLRMKQNMVESDHEAVFSSGKRLPVLIYDSPNGERKLVIEAGNQFFEAKLYPGFARMELSPEVRAEREAEAAQTLQEQSQPKNFAEANANSHQQAMQAAADRYASRKHQNGIVSTHALTSANREHAAVVAAGKGQRRFQD